MLDEHYSYGWIHINGEDYLRWYQVYMVGPGPATHRPNSNYHVADTSFMVQAKPNVTVATPVLRPPSVPQTGGAATITASIGATTGATATDQVVVEINQISGNSSFTFDSNGSPGQRTPALAITPGGNINIIFTVTTSANNTGTGDNNFSVRVVDVIRNGTSVYANYAINPAGVSPSVPLNVTPTPPR